MIPWRIVPNTCIKNRLVQSVHGSYPFTFIRIRRPPRTLPTPPWRRRTLCPMLISLNSCFFLIQLLQNGQCLSQIRSALHWHSVGTCLVRMKPPITLIMVIFLWGQLVGMIFVRKIIQLSTSIFVSTIFNHSIAEMFHLVWIYHGHPGRTPLVTSSVGWLCSIPCLPASDHIDVREVVLSWRHGRELKEDPSKLRPGWPWKAGRSRFSCPDGSVQYWIFLVASVSCHFTYFIRQIVRVHKIVPKRIL